MNQLTVSMFPMTSLTMSSLEIAELVESRHDVVKLSMERLAERGVISLSPAAEVKIQRERREETTQVYNVGKRDSYVVVAQLSPEFTGRLVDRWQELEDKNTKPMTIAEAVISSMQLIVEQEKRVALLETRTTATEIAIARLTGESSYMAILAWAKGNGLVVARSKASRMGKLATTHCKLKGIEVGTVHDERYGLINTYPEAVLDLLFKPVSTGL